MMKNTLALIEEAQAALVRAVALTEGLAEDHDADVTTIRTAHAEALRALVNARSICATKAG